MGTNPLEPRPVPLANGWRWVAEAAVLFRRQPVTWNLMFLLLFGLEMVLYALPVVRIGGGFIDGILTSGVLVAAVGLRGGNPARVGQLFSCFSPERHVGRLLLLRVVLGIGMILILMVTGALSQFTFGSDRVTTWVNQLQAWQNDPAHFDFSKIDLELISFSLLVVASLAVPLLMAAFFAPARIVLDSRSVIAAVRESFRACLRNMGPFLIYSLVLMALLVLALVPVIAMGSIGMQSGGTDRAFAMIALVVLLEILMFRPIVSLSVFTAYCDLFPSSVTSPVPVLHGARRPPP